MQNRFDIVISGFTISGCLMAVLLSRFGLKVCLIEQQKSYLSGYKVIFNEPFDHFGIPEPEWDFNWLNHKISGRVSRSSNTLNSCAGIVLNQKQMILDMLKDCLKYKVTIIKDNKVRSIESEKKSIKLNDAEEIKYKLLICTEDCPYPMSDFFKYMVSVQVEDYSKGNPGVIEEFELKEAEFVNIPIGDLKSLVFYSQHSLKDFKQMFISAMSSFFDGLNLSEKDINPVKFDLRPIQKPFNSGMLCIGKAGRMFLGPWMFEGELEIIYTRYCAEQIIQYFAFGDESNLYRINDYAERLIDYCLQKQGNI